MTRGTVLCCLLVSIHLGLFLPGSARAGAEFIISDTEQDETYPVVAGHWVVWQELTRYGDYDVLAADVSNLHLPLIQEVANTPWHEYFPATDGATVVWQEQMDMDSDADIGGAPLDHPLDRYTVAATSADETLPIVSGHRIVWQQRIGNADSDVMMATLSEQGAITTYLLASSGAHEFSPCVDGPWVIWHLYPSDPPSYVAGAYVGNPEEPIHFYTWFDLGETQIPHMDYPYVVGMNKDINGRIYWDNMADPLMPAPIPGTGDAANPKGARHIVVYEDIRGPSWDVYGYNLITKQEFPIAKGHGAQRNPSISYDSKKEHFLVVWQDQRNDDNFDIYGRVLDKSDVADKMQ